jgi:release factor glutamine methyltransferase
VERVKQISKLQINIVKQSGLTRLDAQTLLAKISGHNRAWLLAHPEATLTPEQAQNLATALDRLETGVPLPYVLGHWEFFGLGFTITADTLIPRPETEMLVEQALDWLRAHPGQRRVADVGTGSGCIAVSLAVHNQDLQVIASDISPAALELAHTNALKHEVRGRVTCLQADLLAYHIPHARFDMICANLPYIPTRTLAQLDILGREPTLALDGGADGLELIRRLLPQAVDSLTPGGLLLLEIEANCGVAAQKLAREFFPEAQIELLTDLAGHDRLIRIETLAD